MSKIELTLREQEYLNCEVPMVSTGAAVGRVTTGILASLLQSVFTPSFNKADNRLFRTIREIKYTKYKKAVLRKQAGTPLKKDTKLLEKLNKKDFVLSEDTYDPDEFTRQMYEEYMKNREQRTENNEQ